MLLWLVPVRSSRAEPGVARLGVAPAGGTGEIEATTVVLADRAVAA